VSRICLAAVIALAILLPCATRAAAAAPPGLTRGGRALWQFEALLHDTFHKLPVSAHYDQGRDWKFAACGRIGCAPLSYWAIYFFTFRDASHSQHLSARRTLPSFGNYPIPIKVKGRYVACNAAESRFLIAYGSVVGFAPACLPVHG
jgi:hypothetical protein